MDLESLSYHGIRKLAPMPTVNPSCIPLEGGNNNSPGKLGFGFPTGSPPLSPNLEDNTSGYSPLLKRSFGGFSSMSTPTRIGNNRKNKPENSIIGVLAAQTLKIASINGLGELDKLENDLEEEINYENKSNAKTVIGRLRREGHHHLHSKVVLFLVVLLNIIDCLLVMGELTLDFHHVSHLLQTKKAMVDSFADELEDKYSPHLDDLVKDKRHVLLQTILDSSIMWPQDIVQSAADNVTLATSQCYNFITTVAELSNQSYEAFVENMSDSDWTTEQPISSCFQPLVGMFKTFPGDEYKLTSFDEPNEKLIIVAHKLHYISVAILSVLVILLLLKIICAGKRFLRSKMAVFDGIVVVISFTLDVVFIKGIHIFNTDDFVIILTFLLPWRIIRVLNSLIAAVLDKQRLNLKIIYTQKKKITRNLTEVNNKVEVMQRQIQILQGLCSSRGITDVDVRKILGTDHKSEKHEKSESKKHQSGHGLASMMALGKLAFQAADALAPMPDIKGRSTPTSPVATPIFSKHPLQTPSTTDTSSHSTTTTPSSNHRKPVDNGSVTTGIGATKNSNSTAIANGDVNNDQAGTGTNIKSNDLQHSVPDKLDDAKSKAEEDFLASENLDIPDVSESASLDIESAATISMDLRDDDDEIGAISASTDDVNVQFEMENETLSSSFPAATRDDNHINGKNAISRL